MSEEQIKLSKKVILKSMFDRIETVAGFDCSFDGIKFVCAGVVLSYKDQKILDFVTLSGRVSFPYIPTFLSYRELPAILKAYNALKTKPDIILVDGQGICHPRGLGIASHLGVILNKPTIGVAKSKLCGEVSENKIILNGKQVGWCIITKTGCKPLFISPGHKVSLEDSLKIVKVCIRNHKLPEPLRYAHLYANRWKHEGIQT